MVLQKAWIRLSWILVNASRSCTEIWFHGRSSRRPQKHKMVKILERGPGEVRFQKYLEDLSRLRACHCIANTLPNWGTFMWSFENTRPVLTIAFWSAQKGPVERTVKHSRPTTWDAGTVLIKSDAIKPRPPACSPNVHCHMSADTRRRCGHREREISAKRQRKSLNLLNLGIPLNDEAAASDDDTRNTYCPLIAMESAI